jgi:hypothetical protein
LYILVEHLFLQIGLAFGVDFSPANWEIVRCVQSMLADCDTSLVSKHHTTLNQIQWYRSLHGC